MACQTFRYNDPRMAMDSLRECGCVMGAAFELEVNGTVFFCCCCLFVAVPMHCVMDEIQKNFLGFVKE